MHYLRVFALSFAALALSGCVTPIPPQELPEIPADVDHQLGRHELLDVTNHLQGHLDDEMNIVYMQSQGGGGAGLGLALGPLGVAANIGMIAEVTKTDIENLGGQIVAAVPGTFAMAAALHDLEISDSSDSFVEISPYLYVTRVDDTNVRYAAAILLRTDTAGVEWTGKFMSQLPLYNTLEEAAEGVDFAGDPELRSMLEAGFADVINLYQLDRGDMLGLGEERKIKSPLLSPRFNFELTVMMLPSHDPDRLLFRLPSGVFSLQPTATVIIE